MVKFGNGCEIMLFDIQEIIKKIEQLQTELIEMRVSL